MIASHIKPWAVCTNKERLSKNNGLLLSATYDKLFDSGLISFTGDVLNTDKLSTSCKTVLNVMYYPEKVFCLKECGYEALEILFALEKGAAYSDYAMIPFDFDRVLVCSDGEMVVMDDYEELKEWWKNTE